MSNYTNNEEKKSLFTPRMILRILSLLCIVFVFCPAFLVSCSGQEIKVDLISVVGGMTNGYGQTVVDAHPFMLVCLILPIVVLVAVCKKKLSSNTASIVSMLCMATDFIIWILFKIAVEKKAQENYCEMQVTGWFYLNMISMLLIVVLSLLVQRKMIQMDLDFMVAFSGERMQETIGKLGNVASCTANMVNKVRTTVSSNIGNNEERIGYCSECGTLLIYGTQFCTKCGTKIPSNIIEEAERQKEERLAKQSVISEAGGRDLLCQQCGNKLDEGIRFCMQCGTKVTSTNEGVSL